MPSTYPSPSAVLHRADDHDSIKWVSVILVFSITYQALLALIHTHIHQTSSLVVAMTEFLLYLGCILILSRRIRLEFVALISLVLAYLFVLSIFRNALEVKGLRDAMIPLLFYWLGRHVANTAYADRLVKMLVWVVLAFGFFELFFLELYTRLINIFSYYVSTGTVTLTTNYIRDSALNLNGLRPDGIGRTIFPSLLGSHRISSVFLEPVSLGNFSVIVAAWGLSKPSAEFKQTLFLVLAAMTLIALSDSRYGLIVVTALIIMRLSVKGRLNDVAIILPFVSLGVLILIARLFEGGLADNVMGRLFWTGHTLLSFDISKLLGIQGFRIPYGDMGYAYLLSRWGVLLCLALWVAFWMVKIPDASARRFRAYTAIYISLILTVSGTSFFALKTAGLLWFLVGVSTSFKAGHVSTSHESAQPRQPGWGLRHVY